MQSSNPDLITRLTAFAAALRVEGATAGTGQVITFLQAVRELGPSDLNDIYWAGRLTLVSRHSELATFDGVFRRFFGVAAGSSADEMGALPIAAPDATAPTAGGLHRPSQRPGRSASDAESLRHRDFTDCTPEELEELRSLMESLSLATESVRTRRYRPAHRGQRDDLRMTLRAAMRTDGELLRRRFRRRRTRKRTLVLLLDVSGSMSDYSNAFLRFAYAARHSQTPVEVFCFGTHIARVTDRLAGADPAEAVVAAAADVFDWNGGTRIGESLHTFNRQWGGRSRTRGGIVVICSDGLEKGDPARLAGEMARLSRRARRVIWLNPRAAHPLIERFPNRSISAVAPYVDEFATGHNLASLETLAKELAART